MNSLEKNKFYNALITTFKKRYTEASDKCWLICVPINSSIESVVINEKLICAHILKPSPLLKHHFVPANGKHSFDVELNDEFIKVNRGFNNCNAAPNIINIVGEETGYNSQNKCYRILICDNSLINSNNKKSLNESQNSKREDIIISFKECESYLKKLSFQYTEVLEIKVNKLLNTYIILPKFIEDAANRFKVLIDWGIDCFRNFSVEEVPELYLESAVESYVIGLAYHKIFPVMCKRFEKENHFLNEKLLQLYKRGIDPNYFGAQKLFKDFAITTNIINQLSSVESGITPLEKLFILRNTLDFISDELKKQTEYRISPLEDKLESILIMSDDLIATVICTLCSARLNHFIAHIEYIQTFSRYLPRNNEFAYSLVTFEAAKQFITNYNLDESIDDSGNQSKLEQTLNEASYSCSYLKSASPLDRELERIGKMIDSNTKFNDLENRQSFQSENSEDLGEFLASLSNNSFSVGCGKQF